MIGNQSRQGELSNRSQLSTNRLLQQTNRHRVLPYLPIANPLDTTGSKLRKATEPSSTLEE